MPSFDYSSPWPVNFRTLRNELEAAGFTGVVLSAYGETQTITVVVDSGDPSTVVAAHVYTEDPPLDLVPAMDAIRTKFNQAWDGVVAGNQAMQAAQNLNDAQAAFALFITSGLAELGQCLRWTGRLLYHVAAVLDLSDAEIEMGQLDLDK